MTACCCTPTWSQAACRHVPLQKKPPDPLTPSCAVVHAVRGHDGAGESDRAGRDAGARARRARRQSGPAPVIAPRPCLRSGEIAASSAAHALPSTPGRRTSGRYTARDAPQLLCALLDLDPMEVVTKKEVEAWRSGVTNGRPGRDMGRPRTPTQSPLRLKQARGRSPAQLTCFRPLLSPSARRCVGERDDEGDTRGALPGLISVSLVVWTLYLISPEGATGVAKGCLRRSRHRQHTTLRGATRWGSLLILHTACNIRILHP